MKQKPMKQLPRINNLWANAVRTIFWIFLLFLITGCQSGSPTPLPTEAAHFVPPTSNPAQQLSSGSAPTPLPTRQANCENLLEFIDDLTIPDGTEVLPGEKIIKQWLIKNTGSCNWNSSYSLQLISGLALGAEKVQGLYPARQSTKAILEIRFSAPDNPGRYNSWWQAYDQDGTRFGDPFYVEISVVEKVSEDG
jgi:hypothetical protein